jgi:hypothetical protein
MQSTRKLAEQKNVEDVAKEIYKSSGSNSIDTKDNHENVEEDNSDFVCLPITPSSHHSFFAKQLGTDYEQGNKQSNVSSAVTFSLFTFLYSIMIGFYNWIMQSGDAEERHDEESLLHNIDNRIN